MKILASAPAKAILFGEHAVVYGHPAVAVPLQDIRAKATLRKINQNSFLINAPELGWCKELTDLPVSNPIRFAIELFVSDYIKHPLQGFELTIQSDIPIASGMGSGAAVCTALFKALFKYFNLAYTAKELSNLVYEVEKLHHGTPSGIDNTVTAYEKAVLYRKNAPIEMIHFPNLFTLLIAVSGFSTPTKVTVAEVRQQYENKPDQTQLTLDQIECCTLEGLDYLQNGEFCKAGLKMRKNHELLKELAVSNVKLDALVNAAISAGAYGAKLSGGGRGGIVIALVNEDNIPQVKSALLTAGAVECFTTNIGGR